MPCTGETCGENCVDNTNGTNHPGGHTNDDCILANGAQGVVCDAVNDLCCDWTLDENGERDTCDCVRPASSVGFCDDTVAGGTDQCEYCMCIAEAGGEPPGACVEAVICTLRNRAAATGGNECSESFKKTTDGFEFTSAKCVCDQSAPSEGVPYNQKFCSCCRAEAQDADEAERCEDAQNDADCTADGFNSMTYFNSNGTIPASCTGSQTTPVTFEGSDSCKHKFYACPYP